MTIQDLRLLIGDNETIIWEGKPDKKTLRKESIFNPLLPFAIIWGAFDICAMGIGSFFTFSSDFNYKWITIPVLLFFILHMMPVWIYLGGVLLISKRYKNTNYIITDKGIYATSGLIKQNVQNKPFAEMSHIDLHRGFFDRRFNVGDIICTSAQGNAEGKNDTVTLSDIRDYDRIYKLIKKLQQDVYSDIMYPNDFRPDTNHGYNTQYRGY